MESQDNVGTGAEISTENDVPAIFLRRLRRRAPKWGAPTGDLPKRIGAVSGGYCAPDAYDYSRLRRIRQPRAQRLWRGSCSTDSTVAFILYLPESRGLVI